MSATDKSGHGMLLISADESVPLRYVTFPDADFRGMAKFIGATYIERVRVGLTEALAVDEEGLYSSKALNVRASVLYGTPRHGNPIIGDALFGIEEMTPEGVDWAMADAEVLAQHLQGLLKGAPTS